MTRLNLPMVTLCAATSVNLDATIAALTHSLAQVDFAECLLFTDAQVAPDHPAIRIVPIARLDSARDYSAFILNELADHVRTSHCLVIQWDGFVLDTRAWRPAFLEVDYVGARWPQFADGHEVGNGGFSLRSLKLLRACREADFQSAHPEDVAICRRYRVRLETRHGIRFADPALASSFAFERVPPSGATFGFHGVFNLAAVLGVDRFWALYRSLDAPGTAFVDYQLLMRQLGAGRHPLRRRIRLTLDGLSRLLRRPLR